ncbi:putative transcription factor [Abeliophyllum distichum]|uniref:Transcription factor n=1 Tax=Abeliophyllum distichum TaxID=126358 RepID=A0ABD1U351_9LAMI
MQNQPLEEETLIEKIHSTELEAAAEQEVGSNSDSVSNFEASEASALEGKTQTPKAAEQQKKGSNSDLNSKSLKDNNDIIVPTQSNELIQKKPPVFFSHIFTDNDVIALLQSLIDFKSHHRDKNMTFLI